MSFLAEIALLASIPCHFDTAIVILHNLWAEHGPVDQLAILVKGRPTHMSLIVHHGTHWGARALARIGRIHSGSLQFFSVQWQDPTGAHSCEDSPHQVDNALWVCLLHCLKRAVWVPTEIEQELHHLTEGSVPGNWDHIGRTVHLTDFSLRCRDLAYVHAENRRFCLFWHGRVTRGGLLTATRSINQ